MGQYLCKIFSAIFAATKINKHNIVKAQGYKGYTIFLAYNTIVYLSVCQCICVCKYVVVYLLLSTEYFGVENTTQNTIDLEKACQHNLVL